MISEERRKEIDEEVAKVFGADFVRKANELPEERTWCCWVLSECEVLRAMVDAKLESVGIVISDENREAFIKEVVDKFKDALSIMAAEWEAELKVCVDEVVKDWREKGLE